MAYSYHQHLLMRPEDIWFAILTQFSIYIKKHAEELRKKFVAHTGKKELEVKRGDTRYMVDHNYVVEEMAQLIEKNIVDPELRRWVTPAFTTTSKTDEVVASILMIGALQKYFTYKFTYICGIPSILQTSGQELLTGEGVPASMRFQDGSRPSAFGTRTVDCYTTPRRRDRLLNSATTDLQVDGGGARQGLVS